MRLVMSISLSPESTLPTDGTAGTLIGRVWIPELDGPSVVVAKGEALHDITASFPTVRDLCEARNPAQAAGATPSTEISSIAEILANTPPDGRDPSKPWLLAPIDLQAIKAAGVTFAVSMIERVIEERARGNPQAAEGIRRDIADIVGDDLQALRPGSRAACGASISKSASDRMPKSSPRRRSWARSGPAWMRDCIRCRTGTIPSQ